MTIQTLSRNTAEDALASTWVVALMWSGRFRQMRRTSASPREACTGLHPRSETELSGVSHPSSRVLSFCTHSM
jgi:hypothetical protein